jgi:hypothetical protein
MFLGTPAALPAQQVTATTLPLKDSGTRYWEFFGDIAVGLDYDAGVVNIGAKLNAYSLSEHKFLWRYDLRASSRNWDEVNPYFTDVDGGLLYVGNGPFNVVDVKVGAVRWAKTCDDAGFVHYAMTTPLANDKLLIVGSEKCDKSGLAGNLKQKRRVMLVDGRTGQLAWEYEAKPKENKSGFFLAQLAASGGFRGRYSVSYEFDVLPLAPAEGGYRVSYGNDIERVLVTSERLEILNYADGKLLSRTTDEVGKFVAVAGAFAYFVKDNRLVARDLGSGSPTWSLDIGSSRADVYTAEMQTDSAVAARPAAGELLVATNKTVFRVDGTTGTKRWALGRDNATWQAAQPLVIVGSDEKVVAYDYESAAPRWEVKAGKRAWLTTRVEHGGRGVGVLVDRGTFDRNLDEWVGPYRFWGVDLANGQVIWFLDAVEGAKITSYELSAEQLRAYGERTIKPLNLSLGDGSPAAAPTGAQDLRWVWYSRQDKALRAQDYAGTVVWERLGEKSSRERFEVGREVGIVLWPAKDGTVEVIRLNDGTSLWKQKLGGDPRVWFDGRHNFVVQHGSSVTLLRVLAN